MQGKEPRKRGSLAGVEPPPRALLEGVRSRDPKSLDQFFDHYFHRIYGLVRYLVRDREAAEDVTQDVFYRVHQAAERLDPDRDPGPWLTVITCNTCRKYWRSKSHKMERRSSSFEDAPGLENRLTGSEPGPNGHLIAAEQETMVREAIESLPADLKESVVLHAYQGMGHEEIATLMGVSHAAARKRYSRALAELGRQLKDLLS